MCPRLKEFAWLRNYWHASTSARKHITRLLKQHSTIGQKYARRLYTQHLWCNPIQTYNLLSTSSQEVVVFLLKPFQLCLYQSQKQKRPPSWILRNAGIRLVLQVGLNKDSQGALKKIPIFFLTSFWNSFNYIFPLSNKAGENWTHSTILRSRIQTPGGVLFVNKVTFPFLETKGISFPTLPKFEVIFQWRRHDSWIQIHKETKIFKLQAGNSNKNNLLSGLLRSFRY